MISIGGVCAPNEVMSEKEEIKQIGAPDKGDLSEALSATPPPNYAKTAGEKIHNEITFRGVDWIANTAFAVAFTYFANRTPTGRNLWSEPMQARFRSVLKPFVKTEQTLQRSAELGTDFASIIVGGTVIIPPMIALDRNKRPIVEYFDRKIYGDEAVENEERFKVRYEALEQTPKKDFSTGMLARGIVLAPMITAHMNKHTHPILDYWMYQPIASISKGACEMVGIKPARMMQEGMKNKDGVFVSNWDYLHTTLGFDTSLTFIYSYAHEWAYKALANLFHGTKSNPQHPLQDRTRVSEASTQPTQAPSAQLAAGEVRANLGQLMQAPASEVAHG